MSNRLRILYNQTKLITKKAQTHNYYDADSTHTETSIDGFEIVGPEEYCDIITNLSIEDNKPYTLLYVEYTTGDSFSTHSGKIEFIDLFDPSNAQDLDILNYNIDIIKNDNVPDVTLKSRDCIKYKIYAPWWGYFETLNNVKTKTVYKVNV